jgi:pseudaminic acid cytidylyltransferase
MNIAVIPARGNSKRIPRKNIKEFNGKPIIAYSIEAAIEANCFDEVVVSTDDEEIAAIARSYGAKTPFLRPHELSDDYTTISDVIRHSIHWYCDNAQSPDLICCIFATAPLLRSKYILEGLEKIKIFNSKFSFSVTDFSYPIQRAIYINDNGLIEMFNPKLYNMRSQDLKQGFHDAGQFYWGTKESWLIDQELFNALPVPVILPRYLVQDIDTMDDWKSAEIAYRVINSYYN